MDALARDCTDWLHPATTQGLAMHVDNLSSLRLDLSDSMGASGACEVDLWDLRDLVVGRGIISDWTVDSYWTVDSSNSAIVTVLPLLPLCQTHRTVRPRDVAENSVFPRLLRETLAKVGEAGHAGIDFAVVSNG